MALAPAASIAIQNALAYQQRLSAEVELTESYERLPRAGGQSGIGARGGTDAIARELHDQLGQALTAMKFDLAWLTARLVQKDATLAHKAKAVTAQMDTMIKPCGASRPNCGRECWTTSGWPPRSNGRPATSRNARALRAQ